MRGGDGFKQALSRAGRQLAKRGLHGLFRNSQRLGVDVLPRHFYSSIPDFRELNSTEHWRAPLEMVAVAGADLSLQLAFVESCLSSSTREWLGRNNIYEHACRANGAPGYGRIEAEFLFSFVTAKQPKRIVQVGAGVSTAVILEAAKHAGIAVEMTCVDPYPTQYLRDLAERGTIRLCSKAAQEVPREVLADLGANGFLFVDSTHTVKPGSEVNRIVLDILPRLPAGTYVHFHDIYFPFDYQRDILSTTLFSTESTLVHAYLVENSSCSLAASLSMLHYGSPEKLQALLPQYIPADNKWGMDAGKMGDFPSALYLRRTDPVDHCIWRGY